MRGIEKRIERLESVLGAKGCTCTGQALQVVFDPNGERGVRIEPGRRCRVHPQREAAARLVIRDPMDLRL